MNAKEYKIFIKIAVLLILFSAIGVLRLYTGVLDSLDTITIAEWKVPDAVWEIFHAFAGIALLFGPALYWWGFKKDGAVLTGMMYGAGAVGLIAKAAFKLPRPPGSAEPTYGYPSGSAQNAAMGWGFTAKYSKYMGCIAVAVSFLVGLSRMGLGDHYFTDVVGGWLLGVGSLYVALYLSTVKMPEDLWKRWTLILVVSAVLYSVGWKAELVPKYVGIFTGFLLGYSTMSTTWEPVSKVKGVVAIVLGFLCANILENLIVHLSESTASVVFGAIVGGLWIALCPRLFVKLRFFRYTE